MIEFDLFSNNSLNYIFPTKAEHQVLSIFNNGKTNLDICVLSKYEDSFFHSFYFYKIDKSENYLIININSLKVLGVEETSDESFVVQNKVNFTDKYLWKIIKSNKEKEYFIELSKYKKRLDISNNQYLIINSNNKVNQTFKLKKCNYQVSKTDLWIKWEKYKFRNNLDDSMLCIIRTKKNEKKVLDLSQNGTLNFKNFTGEKNQIFRFYKKENEKSYVLITIKNNKYIGISENNTVKQDIQGKYILEEAGKDEYDIPFYFIKYEKNFNYFSEANEILILSEQKQSFINNDNNQIFYISKIINVFDMYISKFKKFEKISSNNEIYLNFKYILYYDLDCFTNLRDLSINKTTKYIDDYVLKQYDIKDVEINLEWLNKFNKSKIESISLNDTINSLDLNLFESFKNLKKLKIPLSVKKIIGSYEKNLPKLNDLECSPELLTFFPGINLEIYRIINGMKEIKLYNKINPLINIKCGILNIPKSIEKIYDGFLDYLSCTKVSCSLNHIKFLNKNITLIISLNDKDLEIIPMNTFVDFFKLITVILPKKLKTIESKAFVHCTKLKYIKIPESVKNIANDSFYNCPNLKDIKCTKELKESLKKHIKINDEQIILEKKDLNAYKSITSIDIPYNTYVEDNSMKEMINLNAINCNPEVLKKLPLNKEGFNNLNYLILKKNTDILKREIFKYCKNLVYLSIPLTVNEIEPGSFDNCHNIRVLECNPIFLDRFKNNYITSLLIPEGVDSIFYENFRNKKHLQNLQNLYLPRSIISIDEGTFYEYKKILYLNSAQKWENDKYFPFRCEIVDGTTTLNRDNFREWFNLKTLIIPNSVKTIYPMTFCDCFNIEELYCSPKYFKYLYIKNVKILRLAEGVERIEKDDFKDFINLIYLKLPDSLKFIDENAFNNTPCLNFENISTHPLINQLRKKELSNNQIKNTTLKIKKNKKTKNLIDLPNYNFENPQKDIKILNNINIIENKNFNNNYDKNENYIDNKKNDDNINNNVIFKNEINELKKERTVEDLVAYDQSNSLYAPYIIQILNSINNRTNKTKNGNGIEGISYQLTDICLTICSKKNFQFKPRPVQLLAILRLANAALNSDKKGSIGEIKTGEGKSFIVSTLAILLCKYGKRVDIVTSNIELAARDQNDQEDNFNLFGISSGVLFKKEEKEYLRGNSSYNLSMENGYDLKVFNNQIVYSTNSNFEFVYLESMFVSRPYRPYDRKYDVVIVDEVDNMFIDQGTSPAMISSGSNVIHYRDILCIIYYNRYKSDEELQKNLDMIFKQCAFFNNEEGFKKIKLLKKAALDSDRHIKNIDYIIENNKVIIIDSHTGLKKPKTKWRNSLHEMVEIKEGLEPDYHSSTFCAVTQHDFFNLYNKILGVTGTIGTEKDKEDLRNIYHVEIFKAPRNFMREKIINYINRPYGQNNIFQLLNEDIIIQKNKGRPVLVIMNNILSVEDFVSQSFLNVNTIKGINPSSDENSRNVAGQAGTITIATSAAGRGVDIKLSKESLNNGGLHVIIPFLMPNQRALEQAAGRCGRQGQPGTCNIYISENDYYLISQPFDEREHNLWKIQNALISYLHNYNEFLFDGKGKYLIPQLEFPFNTNPKEAMKICAFRISKENIFHDKDKNEEDKNENLVKIADYLMDMIKLSWGILFDELTENENSYDYGFCNSKFNDYLNDLEEFIPKRIKSLAEELDYLKSLFNKFNWLDVLIIGAVTLGAIGLSVAFFPAALPALAFGTVAITGDILDAMNRDEKINWGKIFVTFARGCLDGIIGQKLGPAGNIIGSTILNPIEGFLKAKIDGEDYDGIDLLKDTKDGLLEGIFGEISSKLVGNNFKDFEKFSNWKINNPKSTIGQFYNKFSKDVLSKPELAKKINKTCKSISSNILAEKAKDQFENQAYIYSELLQKLTQNNIVFDTIIERKIFKKPDIYDDEDEEEKSVLEGWEKNVNSEFLEEKLKNINKKLDLPDLGKRLKNLVKRKKK